MKLDPSISFLGSLLVLVLCATAVAGTALFGRIHLLMHAWFYLVVATALAVLLLSYWLLGRPPGKEEAAFCAKRR